MTLINLSYEISAIFLLVAAVGALGLIVRQPLIVSLLAAGVAVGPFGLGWISSQDRIELLAQAGISLLLFVVGLKLDLHLIRPFKSWSGPARVEVAPLRLPGNPALSD
jgi:Kef-type K+ transport system membrane component KefB